MKPSSSHTAQLAPVTSQSCCKASTLMASTKRSASPLHVQFFQQPCRHSPVVLQLIPRCVMACTRLCTISYVFTYAHQSEFPKEVQLCGSFCPAPYRWICRAGSCQGHQHPCHPIILEPHMYIPPLGVFHQNAQPLTIASYTTAKKEYTRAYWQQCPTEQHVSRSNPVPC